MDIAWFLAINGANEEEEHAIDRRKLKKTCVMLN